MMYRRWKLLLALAFVLSFSLANAVPARAADDWAQSPRISFGIIGMAGGAVEALKSFQEELNVEVVQLKPGRFADNVPDLARFDAIITSFASASLKDHYKQAVEQALQAKPGLKIFCVGPQPICEAWGEWVGPKNLQSDPDMAAYYGLSQTSIKQMLRYALIRHFGRKGEIVPPGGGEEPVRVFHPKYPDVDSVTAFLERAAKDGKDVQHLPRVALGSWRHHVLFHQPKVIQAIMEELEGQGMLPLCLVADDPGFQERLLEYKPELVIMTSHTREPPAFWQKLGVPRLHALWFTQESIDTWRKSDQPGMTKSSMFHQIVSSELKGATECLTAGGTESGGDGGEEILPIPDRIRRLVRRAKAWVNLRKKAERGKEDRRHRLRPRGGQGRVAQRSRAQPQCAAQLGAFLGVHANRRLHAEETFPPRKRSFWNDFFDHGRQMGSWEPGTLDKLGPKRSRRSLCRKKPTACGTRRSFPKSGGRRWKSSGGRFPARSWFGRTKASSFLVLPKVDVGNVVVLTQPLKGETITASMKAQDPDESLLPPTHHFMATYFWLQKQFHADAVVHFGSHGSEWLYPRQTGRAFPLRLERYDAGRYAQRQSVAVQQYVGNSSLQTPGKRCDGGLYASAADGSRAFG